MKKTIYYCLLVLLLALVVLAGSGLLLLLEGIFKVKFGDIVIGASVIIELGIFIGLKKLLRYFMFERKECGADGGDEIQ